MTEVIASKIFGLFCFIVGAMIFIFGITNFNKGRNQRREWRMVKGVIVGPIGPGEKFRNDAENPAYPVIEFLDHSGRVHSFQSDWTMSGLPGPGSEVDVLYDPENPQNAIYHTGASTYFIPLTLILAGIAVIRAALYYLLDI